MPERPYRWCDVPAGTREAECRGCGEPIYWITTPNGAKMPVDCDSIIGAYPPSGVFGNGQHDGRGVSHFQTCTKAAQFSGQGRRKL